MRMAQYLNESYHFIIGEIWTPQYEAIEMLFTPIPNVHHRSKMRTIDLQSKQSMSQKQSNK